MRAPSFRPPPRLVAASLLGAAALVCAPAVALTPIPIARHVCPDGLEVVVSEMHATPLVTVEIAAHAGAMVEDDRFNGVSHLYEHMFFKGNAAQPDQLAYLARMRALGMEFNGSTSDERVNYFFTTSSDHFADQMAFMRDAIATPLFDAKELDREKKVVTGEIDRNESEPSYFLQHAVEQRVFWKYPTRKWAIGKRSSVLAATTDMLRTLQKRYYVPNDSVLVVTGDVKADDVFALADKLYAGWAKADDPFVKFPIPVHPPIRASEVLLVAQPVENFSGSLVWQGPSSVGPTAGDSYAADLLGQLLDDPGSRFQRTLVDSGLCVSAALWYYTQRHTGEIGVDFEATPDKVDACVSAVVAELPKLKAPDYFGDDEMRNAAHRIEVARALDRETTERRAHAVTSAWASSSLEYDAGYMDALKAVTRDGLSGVLDRWMLGKPFVLGAMASLKQIDAGLTEERLAKLVGVTPTPHAPAKKGGAK
jgi:zinc protease